MTGVSRPRSRMRAQHGEAVLPRHLEVEDDAVDRFAREQGERFVAVERDERLEAGDAPQVVRVLLRHRADVVDNQDGGHATEREGRSMVNVVPRPARFRP